MMKLYYNPASPFARKVRVFAREGGLEPRIEEIEVAISPVSPAADVNAVNPLGKIPALVTEDGKGVFDSRVICAYLNHLLGEASLIPADGPAHWQALTVEALCDGILDASVLRRYEIMLRDDDKRSPDWLNAQRGKVMRGLAMLELVIDGMAGDVGIATIAAGCVCGYQDFRFPGEDWRLAQPKLAGWYEHFSERSSMQTTLPPAG